MRLLLRKFEPPQSAGTYDLLGQLVVIAALDGNGGVRMQLGDTRQDVVHALLGDVREAEGVHVHLDVIISPEERARLGDQRGLAVVLLEHATQPELFQILHLDEQLEPLLQLLPDCRWQV